MNAPLKLGQSIPRREDRRFLTGRGRYADNTAPAGALAVLFVRSPHAHARLIGIDKSAALASPGVAAIYTAEDTVGRQGSVTCRRSARSRTRPATATASRRTCRCRSARCAMSATSWP